MSDNQPISTLEREEGERFAPKFDSSGLLSGVVLDSRSKEVLVVAFMNAEAIELTRQTGKVHFWSRSRQNIWLKGETSGNFLVVDEIRVDCDQDALVIYARPEGPICHTGRNSCFYRKLEPHTGDGNALVWVKD